MLVAMTCAVAPRMRMEVMRPPLIASPIEWLKNGRGSRAHFCFQAEEGTQDARRLLHGLAARKHPAGSPEAFAECYDFFRLGIGAPTMKIIKRAQTTMTASAGLQTW